MSSNPPMVTVACSNTACPAHGVQRRVRLQPAGPGFLAAPRLLCSTCAAEPVTVSGWPPTDDVGGDAMAKISVHGGATDATVPDVPAVPPQAPQDEAPPAPAAPAEPGPPAEPETPAPAAGDNEATDGAADTHNNDGDGADDADGEEPAGFDPAEHNIGDVIAHLDDAHARGDQDEIDRVLAAERAGKARKGILGD